METRSKPRIVIYGVGQFGQYVARLAVERNWPIVAAFNRAGDKPGQDLGLLAGLGRKIDVVVQDCDAANFDNLEADVAVIATTDRLSQNIVAYERMMNAGLNVVCHGSESYFPYGIDTALADRIDYLAKANAVTFTGTGIWDMTRIWSGLLAAGTCTEISSLFHRSIVDAARPGKQLMMALGVGMSKDEFDEKIGRNPGLLGGLYKTITPHVLTALGYTVISASERREAILCEKPIYCALLDRELQPGTCIGTRIVAESLTREGVTGVMHHEGRLFDAGDTEQIMWSITGKPSTRIIVERDDTVQLSASALFNRIRDVIAAPPGIRLISELGPMKHTALDPRHALTERDIV